MYIHQATCISAQKTFTDIDLNQLNTCENNVLKAVEPNYEGIPLGTLRRMGKAVRIGVGSALPILKNYTSINGIVIGTSNGGMEDCIKFLNQVIQYQEGTLTPTNFVQSTPNAIAAQIGLTSNNNGYNITHVHRGLAFENALLDVSMLLNENPESQYILGGLDEISTYNYNIEYLSNWYKSEEITNDLLYTSETKGSIAGEGAAMFLINNQNEGAIAKIADVATIHSANQPEISEWITQFLTKNSIESKEIDLLITGENGDNRLTKCYENCEQIIANASFIARYKHFCGEFPTSTAIALWLALNFLENNRIPSHFVKRNGKVENNFRNILIYNTFKGSQHSLILIKNLLNLRQSK